MGLILGRRSSRRKPIGFTETIRESSDLITYSGDSHLITFAPTGAGKTSGAVITNALTHPGQLIVLDMKGDVYATTAAARRAMGQQVYVLDLRDGEHEFSLNPLDLIRKSGTDIAAIARSFAAEIIERGPDEREPFWNDSAQTLIAGGVTWLLADCPPEQQNLGTLFDLFTGDDAIYDIAKRLDDKSIQHRAAKAAFGPFLQLPGETTRPCVLSTALSHLRLFDADLTRKLTDTTNIDLDGLINGEPMSLYIIVPPHRMAAYRPLLRTWLSQLILAITQRKGQPKTRTLMLVDECGNLGKIDLLITTMTLLRSYGFTIWPFFQNTSQLQVYGAQANTLLDNAGVVQIFGARNLRMAQDLANIVGGLSAHEILALPKDEQLLLIDGQVMRCRQVRHYNDELFTGPRK